MRQNSNFFSQLFVFDKISLHVQIIKHSMDYCIGSRSVGIVSNSMLPAAIMWKIQGSLCSPTEFRLQHIRVPYSNVRVGVKVRRLVEPLVRIKRLLTVLASAELLKVHLQKRKRMSTMAGGSKFWPKIMRHFCLRNQQ